MRKILASLLAVSAGLSVLSGCSGSSSSSGPASQSGSAPASNAPSDSASASQAENKPSGERKTLTVEMFDLGSDSQQPIGKSYWYDWMQEQFGDPNNIDLEWMAIPRAEEVTKLNILMSSGDAPDIIYSYEISLVNNYIKQGGLADLTEAVEKNGQHLKTFLGEETLAYGQFGGKQYVIPQKRLFNGIVGSQIRKDWLDQLGLAVPTTHEEFHSVLKAFQEKDPAGGGKTIPWGMALNDMSMGYFSMQYAFKEAMTEEQFYTDNPWVQPGYREGIRFANTLFNEGLISSEFSLDKDSSQLKAAISNGQVGFVICNVGDYHLKSQGVVAALNQNIPEAEYVPCDPFENYEGKHPKLKYYPYGHYLMVPAASKVPEEAVLFLDWMCQDDVLFTLSSGFEGVHYEIKDGIPVDLDYNGDQKLSSDHNNDIRIIINGRDAGGFDASLKLRSESASPYQDFFIESYKMSEVDGIVDPWYFNGFQEPIEAEAKYTKTLNDKRTEMFVRLYMCDPAQFDATYDALVQEYMEAGGTEVMNARKEVFQRTMAK